MPCEFVTANGTLLLLQEDASVDSTGHKVWNTAEVLARYLEQERTRLKPAAPRRRADGTPDDRRPRALELGAGLGLVGCCLGQDGWRATCTDTRAGGQLELLERNVAANVAACEGMSTHVAELDWLHPEQAAEVIEQHGPFDLIVGSDVVYLEALVEPLVQVLERASVAGGGKYPAIVICVEQRNARSHEMFLERLAERKFSVKRVMHKGWPAAGGPFDEHVHLLRISKKRS